MNIQTVIGNLKSTIASKEDLLVDYQEARKHLAGAEDTALFASVSFLKVSIDELKRILQDLEQCGPEWTPHNCPYAEAETCHMMD